MDMAFARKTLFVLIAIIVLFPTTQSQTKRWLGTRKLYKEVQSKIHSNEWIRFTVTNNKYKDHPFSVICHYKDESTYEVVVIRQHSISRQTLDSAVRIDFLRENYETYTKSGASSQIWQIHAANMTNIYPFGVYNDFVIQEKPILCTNIQINGHWYLQFETIEQNTTYDGSINFDTTGNAITRPEKRSIDRTLLFAKKETGIVDSIVYMEEFGDTIEYKITDLSFSNCRQLIDSLFNRNLYQKYDFYDDKHTPHQTIPQNYNPNKLSNTILNNPMISINGDTSTLKDYLGQWLLLVFCMTGCRPCYEQLEKFKEERDLNGAYYLETLGIKLLFINSTTWRLDLVGAVQYKYNLPNSFASKGITKHTNFPTNPGYVLVSPIGEVVYKSRTLGDYSHLLEIKRKYENNLNKGF